jgi:uncharacterized protein (DUF1330 family)
MAAYVIGHVTVKDPDKWSRYRRQVPATLEPWHAKVLFRGKRTVVLCGEHTHTDIVVIEFPDQQAVENWYGSSDYQALILLRNEAAEITLISYEE